MARVQFRYCCGHELIGSITNKLVFASYTAYPPVYFTDYPLWSLSVTNTSYCKLAIAAKSFLAFIRDEHSHYKMLCDIFSAPAALQKGKTQIKLALAVLGSRHSNLPAPCAQGFP